MSITNSLDGTEDDILWQDDDDIDPFGTDEEAEVVDEEGELYYAKLDELLTTEFHESEFLSIFGNSDSESDFEGF